MQDDSALPIVALPQDLTSLQDDVALPILAPSHELPSSQDEDYNCPRVIKIYQRLNK